MRTTSQALRAARAASKAVGLLGGPVAAARLLGLARYQTAQSWCTHGVPAKYCARIEQLLDSQVTRQQLRPADWRELWPELAAPAVAA
jgi:DNA-binding transcriptional regulator YdaS (Cro superfamily)